MRAGSLSLVIVVAVACSAGEGKVRTGDTGATPVTESTPTGTAAGTVTTTPPFALEVSTVRVGDGLGLRTNLPAWDADCAALGLDGAPCGDADLDGLTDAWEDVALDRLRPAIRFDEAEPLVGDGAAVLAFVGRVAPASDGSGAIRVFVMLGYSVDYGRCGVSAHDGDSERVAMDLALVGPGDADVVQHYTAAHENTITDHGHVFGPAELVDLEFPDDPGLGEPRWMVYASDGKHATYGNKQLCEDAEWVVCLEEDCDLDAVVANPADFTRLAPVWNAGEEAWPFLTDLGVAGFPGEDAWAEQDFCGGLGGGGLLGCAAPVREKLLDDPF